MLDRYKRIPYIYQSKIGYVRRFQVVIREELINLIGTKITDMDIELKFRNYKTHIFLKASGNQMYSKSCVDS